MERDGKRYAVKRDGSEGPEIPEAPEFPSALRKWARNDMTQRGYEIMSLIRPEALKIPALAQVIRYPMIFQNIRYNENVAYPIRNDLTIRKDYKLWRFREDNKHHVPPNTDIERARALKLAREAAQKARNEARKIAGKSATDIENAAREAWEETMVNELPNDTLRMAYLRDWQNDRAANETPRGDFRNQGWWHQILDSSSYLVYAPKDASDIVRAQASILAAYIKDINGVAEMTQENKDAINIWFADRRGRQMPTPKLTGGEVEALGYKNGMVEIVDEHGNKKEVSLQEVRERLSRVVKIGDKIAFASDQAKIGLPTAGIEIGSVIPK
ncbi:MAG: hypothetical protein HYV67_03735 [Candidatus Taylorbacteria bacterium]|nr:hypothetical protein [Candidatus Taylorbacteria bacterium]